MPTWDDGDMTYGQQMAAHEVHETYASQEFQWPCSTMPCQNCFYLMPAGYTVCMSCHRPFIFEALKGSEKRSIK
eukprot:4069253-Heterocapsa_arctica.AAC.1